MWPLLAFVALAALVAVHLRWRARFERQAQRAGNELAELRQGQERSAIESNLRQETVFNSMAEGVLLLDESGKIQFANRAFARLFDLTVDVRGKTLLEAARLPELIELVNRAAQDGSSHFGTCGSPDVHDLAPSAAPDTQNGGHQAPYQPGHELRLPGLEERWLEATGAGISARGQGQGSVIVFHDVTRLKKLERTRQEFVANVSHELRTPLSLIKGYAETLLAGAKDEPETAAKFLRTIDRNADRLKLLVEDLLTLSELESGRLKLDLQSVSARAAAEKVLADLASRAAAKGMRLANEVTDLRLRADPNRLEQVLGNLADNAIKYGHPAGNVTIGSRVAQAGYLELFVQDDGPGIPAPSLERVFERFYRVDKSRSREQGGTGLGLAIVKHIVQSHGGKVWVTSQPGQGARFSFTLPQEAP
jgi:two-component system phosphate regulon sensor histidine kinase PhoR